ncbi:helix-turn-helix domain-containing protein [Paenibacillus tundrae]|uniref:helix-turn-helix domain-containing protein n=1 Tax=Paenibacillus tundrae TaxID=528187 RepID=UPI0030CBCAAE
MVKNQVNTILAQNLKSIREERKLSLDKVAELTGISKTMLGQIERGVSNPTIATVWKIANGLKTSFTSLIHEQASDTLLVKRSDVQPWIEDNGKIRIYPHFPFEDGRHFEMYMMEMDLEADLQAEPHIEGSEEFITVFEGEVVIRIEEEEYMVRAGESIRFRANRPHAYQHSGAVTTKMSMVIHYSK